MTHPMELPDCLHYLPGWIADPQRTFEELAATIDWEQRDITIAGRTTPLPRLTCWMGDAALRQAQDGAYSYSGVRNEPKAPPPRLAEIQHAVEAESKATYNSCLANLYRDGSDSIGYHSDDEPELGPEPTIASISLGDRRRFHLRQLESGRRWTLELGAGDLLIMSGRSQADFRHAVPKTTRPVGPRLNLTFRYFHATS